MPVGKILVKQHLIVIVLLKMMIHHLIMESTHRLYLLVLFHQEAFSLSSSIVYGGDCKI